MKPLLLVVTLLFSACAVEPPPLDQNTQNLGPCIAPSSGKNPGKLLAIIKRAIKEWKALRESGEFVTRHMRKHFDVKYLDETISEGGTLPSAIAQKAEWRDGKLIVKATGERLLQANHAVWLKKLDEEQVNSLFANVLGQARKFAEQLRSKGVLRPADLDALEPSIKTIGKTTYELKFLQASKVGQGMRLALSVKTPGKPLAKYVDNLSGETLETFSDEAVLIIGLKQNGTMFSTLKTAYGGTATAVSAAVMSTLFLSATYEDLPDHLGPDYDPVMIPELLQLIAQGDAEAIALANDIGKIAEAYHNRVAQQAIDNALQSPEFDEQVRDTLAEFLFDALLPLLLTDGELGNGSVPYPLPPDPSWTSGPCQDDCPPSAADLAERLVAITGRTEGDACELDIARREIAAVLGELLAVPPADFDTNQVDPGDFAELFDDPETASCHTYRWGGNFIDNKGTIYYSESPTNESGLSYSLTGEQQSFTPIPQDCRAAIREMMARDRILALQTELEFGGSLRLCGTPSEVLDCVSGFIDGIRQLESDKIRFTATNSTGRSGGGSEGQDPISPGTSYQPSGIFSHVPIPYNGAGSVGVISYNSGGGKGGNENPGTGGGCSLYSGGIPHMCLSAGVDKVDSNTGEVPQGQSFRCGGRKFTCLGDGAWAIQ